MSDISAVGYEIREVRSGDWRLLKELRLVALADPVSDVAFYESYETGLARPDSEWQQRAAQAEEGHPRTTFIAEVVGPGEGSVTGPDGENARWAAMLTALMEGTSVWIVGVYTRPEHRGSGIAARLFRAAERWAFSHDEVARLELHVHETNDRARAFYQRLGFVPTGKSDAHPKPPYGVSHVYELERGAAEHAPGA